MRFIISVNISLIFRAGSRMRLMFQLMNKVGSQMSDTFKDQVNKGQNNEVEFKDFARRFTVDIIATCAFGIEVS